MSSNDRRKLMAKPKLKNLQMKRTSYKRNIKIGIWNCQQDLQMKTTLNFKSGIFRKPLIDLSQFHPINQGLKQSNFYLKLWGLDKRFNRRQDKRVGRVAEGELSPSFRWLSGWGRQQKKSAQRPEEGRAKAQTDSRRPCAWVARELAFPSACASLYKYIPLNFLSGSEKSDVQPAEPSSGVVEQS